MPVTPVSGMHKWAPGLFGQPVSERRSLKNVDVIEEDTDGLWPPRAGAQVFACTQDTCAYKHMNVYISHIHVDKET